MEDQAEHYYKEGSVFFKNGHYPEALASCNKALAIRPDYADAWNGRGVALAELKQPAEALASYDKALAIRPDYANAWINRGWALVELGRHEEAVASYDKGLALNPEDASAWFIRGAELGISDGIPKPSPRLIRQSPSTRMMPIRGTSVESRCMASEGMPRRSARMTGHLPSTPVIPK